MTWRDDLVDLSARAETEGGCALVLVSLRALAELQQGSPPVRVKATDMQRDGTYELIFERITQEPSS